MSRMMRRGFYWLVNALSEDDLPLNAGEFRLVDRRILDELRRVEDTSPYVRGSDQRHGLPPGRFRI